MEDINRTVVIAVLLFAPTAAEPFLKTNASRDSKLKMLLRVQLMTILLKSCITIR